MKRNYYQLLLVSLMLTTVLTGQTFNWEEQIIENHNENLQSIAVAEDSSASMVGFGNTFVKSSDGGDTWKSTGIFEKDAFDYQDISFAGNIGFAVAMTGYKVVDRPIVGSPDLLANSPLLKTTDGGDTWKLITVKNMGSGSDSTLNISAIGNYSVKFTAVEVVNATTVYLSAYWKDVTGGIHQNVFVSTNTGETWEHIIPDNGGNTISSIVEHNGNIYIAGKETLYKVAILDGTMTDLYPTVDEGEDDDMYFTNTSISGNELIFPTYADSIRVTSDEGTTFSTIPDIKKGNYTYKHDTNNIVVVGGTSDTKATNDGGVTWTSISAGESLWNASIIGDSLIALGKKEIFTMALSDIAAGNFAWTSKIITDISGNLKGITMKGDTTFITGYSDIFLRSTDGAQTFTEVTLPSKADIIYASVNVDLICIAQGKGGASIASTRRYKLADYPSKGPSDVYISAFLFATTDNWSTFKVLDDTKIGAKYDTPTTNPYASSCYGQEFYTVDCVDDSTYLTSVQWYHTDTMGTKNTYGRIFRTTDAGQSWDSISANLGNLFIKTIKANDNYVFVGGNKLLLKSDDYGATQTDLIPQLTALGATNPYIQEVTLKGDTVYIATTSDSVFVSYNNGTTFSKIEGITGATTFIPVDGDSWMALANEAKSKYTNYGNDSTWLSCYPGATVYSSGVYNGNIVALCKGRIFTLPIADLDSDIVAGMRTNRVTNPNNVKIYQINEALNISADKAITTCSIYTITGQLAKQVYTNVNELNISTNGLSGIYLVNVHTTSGSSTMKVIIK